MRTQDIQIGALYDWNGHVVRVTEINAQGVVIECPEIGEDVVKASSLKPIEYTERWD